MVEMTREVDLFVLFVDAIDSRRYETVLALVMARLDFGMKQDVLTCGQSRLQIARLAQRDHESERLGFWKTAQVTPANEAIVFFPPRGALVWRIGDDPGGAKFTHSAIGNRPRLA